MISRAQRIVFWLFLSHQIGMIARRAVAATKSDRKRTASPLGKFRPRWFARGTDSVLVLAERDGIELGVDVSMAASRCLGTS
mmetsp:Transcript_389/g.957  ORF Transcript_389/g.957 Transcript_389/m.957 type:complete len:82 (-) Transcript_389:388-633(-)